MALADNMPRDAVGDLKRQIRDLERAVREMRAERRLESSTIGSGGLALTGGSIKVDGGDVVMLNEAGVALFRIGVSDFGDRALTIRREDGSLALRMGKALGPSDPAQAFQILDRQGRLIAGDASLSPTGFDAPHIPISFEPVDLGSTARAQVTSATAFTPLFEHEGFRQNPTFRLKVKVSCSDATTAAEVAVYDAIGGAYLVEPFTLAPTTIVIPAGTTTTTTFVAPKAMFLPGSMSDDMRLEVHARVTAGIGSVSVAVARSIGGP